MTLLNRIALGLIAFIAIIAVVGGFAVSHLDLVRQKDQIESFVFDKTGRELHINGNLNATLFPWFGLAFTDLSLGNPEEFSAEFATVKSGNVKVAFLPLLAGKFEIDKIALDGLSLKLSRDADGKTNWDDLMATTAVVETESDDNVMREIEAGAPIIAALSVGDVEVNNSNISYSDSRDESYLAINDLNLSTGTVVLSEPFAFQSDFNLISSAASGITSLVSAKGEIAIDLVNNIYVLQQLQLSTVNGGVALPLDPLPLSLNGELVADFNSQRIDITVADGLLSGVPVSGDFHATGFNESLQLTGQLSSGEFDATPLLGRIEFLDAEQFPVELVQDARVSARFEHSKDILQIREFQASANDIELSGDFQIVDPAGSGVFSGWLQTNPFAPAPWLRGFGLDLQDSSVMRTAQGSADIRQSGQLLSFNQIDFQLDESTITGSVEVSDINADQLPVTYALAIDSVNLDDYLTAIKFVGGLPDTQESSMLPVEKLRQLDLEGEVSVGKITVAGINAQNAVIPLVAEQGKLTIAEATADLYAGSFFSTATLDVQADEPKLSFTGNLNGLSAESLLQDAMNHEPPLAGIANVSVDVLSRGRDWRRMVEQLNGAMSLRVSEGQLRGIDIPSLLQATEIDSESVLSQSERIESTNLDQSKNSPEVTSFSELSASSVVMDGMVISDDLVFSSADFLLTGEGGLNVNTKSIDYLFNLAVASDSQQETLQELKGAELLIPMSGSVDRGSAEMVRFLLETFQTGLSHEIKRFYRKDPDTTEVGTPERIIQEKESLRQRLESGQHDAAAVVQQEEQSQETSADELQRQLEIEAEKNALKDQLRNNLKNNLNGLLSDE